MKLTVFFLLTALLQVSANGFSQQVTLSEKNAPLELVLNKISQQTGYRVFFDDRLMQKSKPVTITISGSVEAALARIFSLQPLSYEIIDGKVISLKEKEIVPDHTSSYKLSPPITIHGRVTNKAGEPLQASITVKGTKNGTSSNADGYYVLQNVDEKAILVVSGISIATREVEVNGKTLLDITVSVAMKEEEEVIVAYNKISQRSNVGAVTVVKGEQLQNLPNRSFDKGLQGLVPGLFITQGTGQPGGGVANFVLRGIATGGSAIDGSTVRNPLIVIDGIPAFQDPAQAVTSSITFNNPMAQINPSDIETITVLKDAAAIALYGSRASNGVILVTTKKGKAGRTAFNFRHQTDLASRLKGNTNMLSQQQYLELLYETYRNTDPVYWTDARIKTDLISKFPYRVNAPGDTSFYSASDWLNELYRKNAATISNEISISGGSEKNTFYFNLEWTKQNGVERKSGYDRRSLRFNYESKPTSWLKLGLNTAFSYNEQEYNYEGISESAAMSVSPLNAIRKPTGEYYYNYSWGFANSTSTTSNGNFRPNPIASSELNINRNISYRGLSKLYGEVKFLKYFTLNSNVGFDFMLTEAKEKVHPLLSASSLSPGIGRILQSDIRNANMITTNLLRFDLKRNVHGINIIAGQEAQILNNKTDAIERQNLTANPLAVQANDGTLYNAYGSINKQTLTSYFGQANYTLLDRYFASASIRRDGSSLFGDNKRFGTHWSVGAGWLVSSESFMKGMSAWLNYLKLRGSMGSAGNSGAIGATFRYEPIALSSYLNTPAILPDINSNPGNPAIQWEKTFSWDVGIELKLFRETIGITADVYTRKTSEVLGSVNLPYGTGFGALRANIGDLKNSGIELSLSANLIQTRHFRWSASANWSTNRNVLTRSFFPLEKMAGNILANGTGENYNSFYMVRWAGVDPATGQPQWFDSTGKPNSSYAAAKPVFVGKPQPDGFGSVSNTISYKGVELSAMLYYQYGFKIYDNTGRPSVNDGVDPYINQNTYALNRWQKPGDIAANPRRLLLGRFNNVADGSTNVSTRYLIDGDFIRLSNVTLSYNLPLSILNKVRIRTMRVFIQGHNLATWTKYSGQDPENSSALGSAGPVYPIQRSWSVGLNVNF